MNPVNLGFDDCGLNAIQKILNKETQTGEPITIADSQSSLRTPKDPVCPPGSESPGGSLTLFEYCRILEDPNCPESVTIIKETISQEIQKHPTKGTSDEGVANRYKYCKEVIQPYIKPHLGCPKSEEGIIKDALDSAHQDFPDYQLCTDNLLHQTTKSPSFISTVDAGTSYESKPSRAKMDSGKPIKKEHTKVEQRPGCFPTNVDTPSGVPDPGCDVKEEKPGKEEPVKKPCVPKKKSLPKVCEPTCEADCAGKITKKLVRTSGSDECPPPIDYCKKQSEYKKKPIPPERKLSTTTKSPPAEDAQCETISQIKTAMEDFISKVYSTTQEAVTLIKTESARQFEKFSGSVCEPESKDKSKDQYGYDTYGKDDSESSDDCKKGSSGKLIENIVDKVDSTINKICDSMDYKKLPKSIQPKNYNDASSKYDTPTPPKEIANIIVQTSTISRMSVPETTSVFATIKTKICSLFCDEEKKSSESRCSSNISRKSENEG